MITAAQFVCSTLPPTLQPSLPPVLPLSLPSLPPTSLRSGNALFAGTATFGYFDGVTYGGQVIINSAGLTLYDKVVSPNAEVAITPSGVFLYKLGTSYSVQVTASSVGIFGASGSLTATSGGIVISNTGVSLTASANQIQLIGPSGTLTANSSGIVISNGASSVTVSSSSVAIANGTFSTTAGSVTVNVDSSNYLKVSDSSNLFYAQHAADYMLVEYSSAVGFAELSVTGGTSLGYGTLRLFGSNAGHTFIFKPFTSSVALSGSATLPSAPVGFMVVNIDGSDRHVPYYG